MTLSQQILPLLNSDQPKDAEHHEYAERVAVVAPFARLVLPGDLPITLDGKEAVTVEPTLPISLSKPISRSFVYPERPTSQSGPWVTQPSVGQHPYPRRTDQMVYESYDQERGEQRDLPTAIPLLTWKQRGKNYLPDVGLQETAHQEQEMNHKVYKQPLARLAEGKTLWNTWRHNFSELQAFEPDLHGADLHQADLQNLDLHQADLTEANLQEANLRGADLHEADLRHADLRKADLSNANLLKSHLHGADMRGALLHNACLTGADFSNTDMRGVDFSGAVLRKAVFREANMSGVNLSDIDLDKVDLRNANLKEAILSNMSLEPKAFPDVDDGR